MESKLKLAKGLALLSYILGGVGLIATLRSSANFAQPILLLCAGLIVDLLVEIGWRVHRLTEPDEADHDPRR